MATVIVRIKLLNVPIHWKAKADLFDRLEALMKVNGYRPNPATPVTFPFLEYDKRDDNHGPTCQIAADIKERINAIHTPSKISVKKE